MPDTRLAGDVIREALLAGEYCGKQLAFCHRYSNIILIGRVHGVENPDPAEIIAQDRETLGFFSKAIRVVANCLELESAPGENSIRVELNHWSGLFEISVYGLSEESVQLLSWDIEATFGPDSIRDSGRRNQFQMEIMRTQPQPVR